MKWNVNGMMWWPIVKFYNDVAKCCILLLKAVMSEAKHANEQYAITGNGYIATVVLLACLVIYKCN